MFLVIVRTFKQSLANFKRNGLLSVAAVSVLILSLYVVGALFVLAMTATSVLKNVESKINISVYFKSDTSEERIMEAKKDIEKFSEIRSVDYVSKEKALEDFKKNNADEPVIIQSLQEIGDNPLLASLVIKANNPSQYEAISAYVNDSSFSNDVSRVNYKKNKLIIDKLNHILDQIKKVGSALAIIFAAVSMMIIFNTIRITIYVHKQEIEVMRLVGASNTYIRLPFIFEGIIYGVIASILASAFLLITVKLVNPYASLVITSQNIFNFYLSKFFLVLGIQALMGISLGILSSWIAMRKYLKI